MKKKLLLIASLFIANAVNAQDTNGIGIGIHLPDPSAVLHVQSDKQGILIPNVILTDLTKKDPIKSAIQESLLVYNKQEKKEGTPEKVVIAKGYYYWIATSLTTGKWIRVITSEDAAQILEGQIQESFVEIEKDVTYLKFNADGKVILDANGNPETETKPTKGFFVYSPDKNKPDVNKVEIEIPNIVRNTQTLTSFGVSQFDLYHYLDGTKSRIKLPEDPRNPLSKTTTELELVYTDEKGKLNKFAVRDLLGADNTDVPAITDLSVNNDNTGLNFTNDKGVVIPVGLELVIKNLEAKTKLEVNADEELVYINEDGITNTYKFPLRSIVKEPWFEAETGKEAIRNNQNIFTKGWVGIGLSAADAATAITELKPDEKLRINGSIYARNSYYADYVFENYFTKEASALKYDYNFKDLASVESFIKTNRHLPGITPIGELDKSNNEGYLINVSELAVQLLEKVEELYLHTIEQQKIIEQQKSVLSKQEERLQQIESLLNIGK